MIYFRSIYARSSLTDSTMDKSPEEELRRTLICKNIPQSVLKRQVLKNHFETFGTVLKLQTSVERGAASVEFETHQQAANARKLGTSLGSHQIHIIWKKKLSRSSSLEDTKFGEGSPVIITKARSRASLFGTALASATGKSVGARPPGLRTLARSKNDSEKSSGAGVSGAPIRQPMGTIKREPVQDGLYDDLPPPSDWSEESTLQQSKRLGKHSAQAIVKDNIFGKSVKPRLPSGTVLFEKKPIIKAEAQISNKQPVVFEKIPLIKKEIIITPSQPTLTMKSVPASAFGKSQTTSTTSGRMRFGKPATVKPVAANVTPFGVNVKPKTETTVTSDGRVPLFGTRLGGADDKPATSQPTDGSQVEGTLTMPSLFGKSQGRRSVSPKPSVMDRLSPAITTPTRSASLSPPPAFRHRLQRATKRSPSPAPFTPIVPLKDVYGSDKEIEWIMPASLAELKQTPANTCSERQALLEKREKIMRQGMNKQSDLSKAKATAGCCPDMCPEKERYTREERRQVHIYEMRPNTDSHPQIDHRIAVKEYSRSSADQEEPLPLELRPAHVLSKTMDYLCNNILDIGSDGTWADWFDFLWNRTRAIRKDITQQHLCSPVAAGLVEKCVRFHIYCGARLVEEETQAFDPKINNENLTKCLQTLKEMYDDLLNRGVECDKEAEFRAYLVLMNLNEGDTLREVQQLRPAVRSSSQMAFALSAYSALSDKNFVKFFKLVKETTFLNACILHRYFNQMRYEALKIILRAYSAPKGPALVTVERLFAMLHFEDEQEGNALLEHYGISTIDSSLSRDSFIEPEAPLAVKRSPALVEGKLRTSIGQAVYGEPLPPNIVTEPTTSFDQRGIFIGIIRPPKMADAATDDTPRVETVKLPPLNQIPSQVVKDAVKQIILDVIDADSKRVAVESLSEEKRLAETTERDVEILTAEVVNDLCKDVAEDVIEEAKRERAARAKAAKQAVIDSICSEFVDELIESVQCEECRDVSIQVYREVQAELLERQRMKCGVAVGTQLIHSHVVSLVEEVAEEVYQSDVVDRLLELAQAERKTRIVLCKRVYKQWVAVYKKRTHLKRAMIEFPAAPPMLPLKRSKEFKVTPDTVQLSKRSRLSVGPPVDMSRRLAMNVLQRKLSLMLSNAPLNMSAALSSALAGDSNACDYMKLLLLHTEGTCDQDRQLCGWLTNKLSVGSVPAERSSVAGKLLSHYTVAVDTDQSMNRRFGVCIRSCLPPQSVALQQSFYGANMAVVLLPYSTEPTRAYWSKLRKQLLMFLQEKPVTPAIPLVLISPLDLPKETVQYEAGAYELLDQRLISHVRVDRVDSTMEYNELLPASIEWLVTNRPPQPDLELTELKSLLESYLTSTFYTQVYQDLAVRQQQDLVHLSPEDIIAYFNNTMARFSEVICDESLESFSWPVYERKCEGLSLEECRYLLYERIQLPEFNHHQEDDWYHSCTDVMSYLDTVLEHYLAPSQYTWICRQPETAPALYSSVKALLAKTEAMFTSRCERQFHEPPHLQPMRQNVPWLHIIVACVEVALSTLDPKVLAMHRPLGGELELTHTELSTGYDMPYADTLTMALSAARADEADNSNTDMERSLYTEPVHALSTHVCDELNASKRFEDFLSSQLEETTGLEEDAAEESSPGTDCDISGSHSDLTELIKNECKETQAFEEFLYKSLLEET